MSVVQNCVSCGNRTPLLAQRHDQTFISRAGNLHVVNYSFFSNNSVPQPVPSLHIPMSQGPVAVTSPDTAPEFQEQDIQANH